MSPVETVKKAANSTSVSIGLLIGGILVAVGPWASSLDSWGAAVSPQNIGILLPIVGGVLMSWLGKSLISK